MRARKKGTDRSLKTVNERVTPGGIYILDPFMKLFGRITTVSGSTLSYFKDRVPDAVHHYDPPYDNTMSYAASTSFDF